MNKMKATDHIANAQITIGVPVDDVWDAFVNPAVIKKYMFGTSVVSDWKEGSKITWKGEWEGKSYEDKGTIFQIRPNKRIQYSHFSPLSGLPDIPENYHTVTVELISRKNQTTVTLAQDNNETEQAREHSEKNWIMMLANLKDLLEKKPK